MSRDSRMSVLMVGVGPETRGGMWSVAKGYIDSPQLSAAVNLRYVATSESLDASFAAKAKRAFVGIREARDLLRQGSVDLAHIHMAERGSFFRKAAVVALARMRRVPVVLHMHGGSFDRFFENAPRWLRAYIRRTLNSAQRIVVLGDRFAELYRAIGVDPLKIEILPNAVVVPETNPYDVDSRDVVYLGLLSRNKGIIEYLDAIAEIDDKRDFEYRFKFFGPEGDVDLVAEIGQRGLGSRVVYGGFLDAEQRAKQLSRSCILVLPSHFEVFPMCVIEAMAYGIPVVSTDVGSVSDAITDGDNGVLVGPSDSVALADAVSGLLAHRETRLSMSEAAYAIASSRYSMESHVRKLLDIYRDIIREGRSS